MNRTREHAAHLFHMFAVAILVPRPEESFQPVPFCSWNYVNMNVRYALADPIVDGEEGPLRFQALLDRQGEQSRICRHLRPYLGGNIDQRISVGARNEQDVAGEQRSIVEKCQRLFILKHNRGGNLAAGDLAKDAIVHT